MPTLTTSLSEEEMRRLKNLSGDEGLTVEQMVRLCVRDWIAQPDELFQSTAPRVLEKNADLYRRLS
ncbi:MAG: hypothetical protein RI101_03140 [Nitrospira sp.]|jgi:hypothetical protein|nr:hypothetical protein [Nitrospira sp.]